MRYEVFWSPAAEAELTSLLAATDATRILIAAQRVDAVLNHCAPRAGESRDLGERVVVEDPLTVWYEVLEPQERVRVLRARRPEA